MGKMQLPEESSSDDKQTPPPRSPITEQGSVSGPAYEGIEVDEKHFNVKYWFGEDGRMSLGLEERRAAKADNTRNAPAPTLPDYGIGVDSADVAASVLPWISDDMYSESSVMQLTPEGTRAGTEVGDDDLAPPPPYSSEPQDAPQTRGKKVPRMDIVMLVVGPPSEILPFISLGRALAFQAGHRVRLATHAEHRKAVEFGGVEFFDIGGSSEDMIWSLSPNQPPPALTKERVKNWRFTMADVLKRSWKACIEPTTQGLPFVADAIIASPLNMAHAHCAEKLGVPLHLMTTVPWTPTGEFGHPLVRVPYKGLATRMVNRSTFAVVESMVWKEIGETVNHFRQTSLQLEPMELMLAPGLFHRLQIPVVYFSTPMISQRPQDWANNVHLCDPTKGADTIIQIFHESLAISRFRCSLFPNAMADWEIIGEQQLISSVVAVTLLRGKAIDENKLRLHRRYAWDFTRSPADPLTGLASSTTEAVRDILGGATAGPREAYRQAKFARSSSSVDRAGVDGYTALASATSKGIGRIMTAGLKSPATFTHGLARGFHNVPRLYGDETVRESERVDGWKSGFVAAGKGFGQGLYDGLTGFVTQPIQGAQTEGGIGFLKGFGKGVGGMVFKPIAGAWSLPGYAFMGIYKEIARYGKTNVDDLIIAGRLARGEFDSEELSEKQKTDILVQWNSERKGKQIL